MRSLISLHFFLFLFLLPPFYDWSSMAYTCAWLPCDEADSQQCGLHGILPAWSVLRWWKKEQTGITFGRREQGRERLSAQRAVKENSRAKRGGKAVRGMSRHLGGTTIRGFSGTPAGEPGLRFLTAPNWLVGCPPPPSVRSLARSPVCCCLLRICCCRLAWLPTFAPMWCLMVNSLRSFSTVQPLATSALVFQRTRKLPAKQI